MEIAAWELWVRSTSLHKFVVQHEPWVWPTCEIIHYLGLSLLLGTVGLFDLRVLGVAKGIPLRAIHRLIPWGIAGYILNILTGVVFLSGHPDQYFYNNAFRLKALFMAVAGANILAFYGTDVFAEMKKLPDNGIPSLQTKIIAGTSLSMWIAVLVCGRLLTFFRPPFFH
jgi:Na+/citrate or Na+/malate symporter